jgi:hypothetical protein
MTKLLAFSILALAACGARSSVPPPSTATTDPSIFVTLQTKLDEFKPRLLTCDGGYTDPGDNGASLRPTCDDGDGVLFTGLVISVDPQPEMIQFIKDSVDEVSGKPYRSPEHKRACQTDPTNEVCNFSRDHTLGHIITAASTKDCTTLSKVYTYIINHNDRVCDGTYAQCSVSVGLFDLMGDTFESCGMKRPAKTTFPDLITSMGPFTTAVFNDTFPLELAVDHAYVKFLTGKYSKYWDKILAKAIQQRPESVYFQYLYNKLVAGSPDSNKYYAEQVIKLIDDWKQPGSSWLWQWYEYDNSNGWDIYFMGKMLLKDK